MSNKKVHKNICFSNKTFCTENWYYLGIRKLRWITLKNLLLHKLFSISNLNLWSEMISKIFPSCIAMHEINLLKTEPFCTNSTKTLVLQEPWKLSKLQSSWVAKLTQNDFTQNLVYSKKSRFSHCCNELTCWVKNLYCFSWNRHHLIWPWSVIPNTWLWQPPFVYGLHRYSCNMYQYTRIFWSFCT